MEMQPEQKDCCIKGGRRGWRKWFANDRNNYVIRLCRNQGTSSLSHEIDLILKDFSQSMNPYSVRASSWSHPLLSAWGNYSMVLFFIGMSTLEQLEYLVFYYFVSRGEGKDLDFRLLPWIVCHSCIIGHWVLTGVKGNFLYFGNFL